MAIQHFFKKALGNTLIPTTEEGREWLSKLKVGEIVRGEFKRPRNVKHHMKFFAMLNLIHQNQTHYKSLDDLLLAFKYHIGHGHWVITKRGPEDGNASYAKIFQPHSISFAKMDQGEFILFFDKAVDFVTTVVIPGLDMGDLERELLEFTS